MEERDGQSRILVTGATGKTGGASSTNCSRGFPVRAVVRQRDARSAALDRRGVETVIADMFDSDQLVDAMRGTQRAYYLPFFHTHMIQSAVAFGIAAREAKLEAIVQMGQWLSHRAHPAIMTRPDLAGRPDVRAASGHCAHTIINPGMFADNFLRVIDSRSTARRVSGAVGRRQGGPRRQRGHRGASPSRVFLLRSGTMA